MPDTTRYRSTCLADGCGGKLVVADDGAWHHVGPHGAGLHPPVPADPTPAEEASYQQGLLVGFRASLDAVTADPDHAERVLLRAARAHGVELTADPEPAAPSSGAADRMSWTSGSGLIITPPPHRFSQLPDEHDDVHDVFVADCDDCIARAERLEQQRGPTSGEVPF